MNRVRHTRRIILPKPSLQLRMVGGFVGVALLALVTQSMYLAHLLERFSRDVPWGGEMLSENTPMLVRDALLFSFVVLLPLTSVVGAYLTFKTAGPIYRFERHLTEVAAGERPGPCRIRRGDDLQELCALINAALEEARRSGHADEESAEEESASTVLRQVS